MPTERESLGQYLLALEARTYQFLATFRRTSALTTMIAVGGFTAILVGSHFIKGTPVGEVVEVLRVTSLGWVDAQLVYPLAALAVMGLAFRLIGALGWSDIGWRRSTLVRAALVLLAFWLGTQMILWCAQSSSGRVPTLRWDRRWGREEILSALCVQLFGNALVEETLFRGHLLPQLYQGLAVRLGRRAGLAVSLLMTTLFAVVVHAPGRLIELQISGTELAESLFWVFRFALAISVVFLVTRNLFLCVGLHALWNVSPTYVQVSQGDVELAWWVGIVLLTVMWGMAADPRAMPRSAVTRDEARLTERK